MILWTLWGCRFEELVFSPDCICNVEYLECIANPIPMIETLAHLRDTPLRNPVNPMSGPYYTADLTDVQLILLKRKSPQPKAPPPQPIPPSFRIRVMVSMVFGTVGCTTASSWPDINTCDPRNGIIQLSLRLCVGL